MDSALQIMEQRVSGLRARMDALRADERLFQRAAGLRTQLEKDRAAVLELASALEAEKKTLDDLRNKKAAAMQATATAIAEKMGQVLPLGRAEFRVDDEGAVFLGWEIPGHGVVPCGGLSGGQRVMFESALAYALAPQGQKNPLILIEGAELGQEIGLLLESVATSNVDTQIIACTCHELASISDGWTAAHVVEAAR
ncbi:hypothetical protein [Desulfovibrio sp. ZJ369]|uniref:hypothetical protein n=1 Tax=Desulfovibrio sp. ZJ369 TaxID=2709793 RepID=UPI0013ED4EE1|nr:hypothetical protein [Desulfovibrio sp. ZJ369]